MRFQYFFRVFECAISPCWSLNSLANQSSSLSESIAPNVSQFLILSNAVSVMSLSSSSKSDELNSLPSDEAEFSSWTLFSGTRSDVLTYSSIASPSFILCVCLRWFRSLKTSFIQPGYEHYHLLLWTLALVFLCDGDSCCRCFLRRKFKRTDDALISSHLCTPVICRFKFTRCLQKMRRKTK